MLKAAIATKARREFTDVEVETHTKTFRQVITEFGLKAFTRAFWQAMANEEKFPEAAIIRRYIVADQGAVTPTQVARNCGKCQDGWVIGHMTREGKMQKLVRHMRRCECKGGPAVDWDEQKRGQASK